MKLESKEGLLYEYNEFFALGKMQSNYKLYADEGYCFYDKTDKLYDEEGNVIPNEMVLPAQRTYMRFIIIPSNKDINDFVVVKIQDGFELVN